MSYNFDKIIPRRNTLSEKVDACEKIFGSGDVLPLWVADMDFAAPPAVTEAIRSRVEHPIYGYSYRSESYQRAITEWVGRHNGWQIDPDWLDFTPGVVSGIVFALRAFTRKGDGIVIQPPIYHPFARQIRLNGRRVIDNPLHEEQGRYTIDFEDLDRKLASAKAFILCNPHNPTGRVFTREELTRIGELCIKHEVWIFSDEIHSDLVYAPHRHLRIAALDPRFAERTFTFIAPSKTFNLAGLSTSVSIVPSPCLRAKLREEYAKLHADQGNIFGTVALEAAYTHGASWLEALKSYLQGNIAYICETLRKQLPSVRCTPPEGTYLMWLDFRAWRVPHAELYRFLVEKAGWGVNQGEMFGAGGTGFMRVNIATQRSVLRQAMKQLIAAARNFPPANSTNL